LIGISDAETIRILEEALKLAKTRNPRVSTALKAIATDPAQFEEAFLLKQEP